MRLRIMALAAAFLTAAGVLAAGPATLASAAPVQAQLAGSSHMAAISLPLTPGTHTVSRTIPVANAQAAASGGQSWVDIRVGKNDCGGYKGVVQWGAAVDILVEGTIWDNCNYYTPNTTVSLWVKWTELSGTYNQDVYEITGVTNTQNMGSNTWIFTGTSPSNIYVTACLQWNNGWGCGTSAHL